MPNTVNSVTFLSQQTRCLECWPFWSQTVPLPSRCRPIMCLKKFHPNVYIMLYQTIPINNLLLLSLFQNIVLYFNWLTSPLVLCILDHELLWHFIIIIIDPVSLRCETFNKTMCSWSISIHFRHWALTSWIPRSVWNSIKLPGCGTDSKLGLDRSVMIDRPAK